MAPGSSTQLRLSPDSLSVRTARRAVVESAPDLPQDELDEMLLCTSEVVTNAVEHGAPPIELVVQRRDHHLRVEVHDGSPLPPRVGDPEPQEARGRGMLIVERCADRWGVEPDATAGKTVWFEIDVPA
jgi:anti-sigma regulatory factor (Ser/Thr protein kinase)